MYNAIAQPVERAGPHEIKKQFDSRHSGLPFGKRGLKQPPP